MCASAVLIFGVSGNAESEDCQRNFTVPNCGIRCYWKIRSGKSTKVAIRIFQKTSSIGVRARWGRAVRMAARLQIFRMNSVVLTRAAACASPEQDTVKRRPIRMKKTYQKPSIASLGLLRSVTKCVYSGQLPE